MASEIVTFEDLARFHRDLIVPSIKEIVADQIDGALVPLREEMSSMRGFMLSHFDAIYHRFDRLETEYQALRAAVRRIEDGQQPPM